MRTIKFVSCILSLFWCLTNPVQSGFEKVSQYSDTTFMEEFVKSVTPQKLQQINKWLNNGQSVFLEQLKNELNPQTIAQSKDEDLINLQSLVFEGFLGETCGLVNAIKMIDIYSDDLSFIKGDVEGLAQTAYEASFSYKHVFRELKRLLSREIVTEETWEKVENTWEKMLKAKQEKPSPPLELEETLIAGILDGLIIAVKKIDNLKDLRSGDTLVAVGNTPQLIVEAHNLLGKKNIRIIPIALSGNPVFPKIIPGMLQNMLSLQGLENYRKYMEKIKLCSKTSRNRIFFLDRVGEAHGIQFLIEQLIQYYGMEKIPDIWMLAINNLEQRQKDEKYLGKIFKVDVISLEMDDLAKNLDRMGDEKDNRIFLDFHPINWSNWPADENNLLSPGKFPIGRNIPTILKMLKKRAGVCNEDYTY